MKYQRLVEIYVKPDLRDIIKALKGGKTSDEFLRELLEKKGDRKGLPRMGSKKSRLLPTGRVS